MPGSTGIYPEIVPAPPGAGHLGEGCWRQNPLHRWVSACEITLYNRKDKSALYFLWVQTCFAYEPSVTNNFSARWNGVFTGMEKKSLKRRRNFLFPFSTLNAFHYSRLLRLDARNLTYEGKLVKIKQNQSHPFWFQCGKTLSTWVSYKIKVQNHTSWTWCLQSIWGIHAHVLLARKKVTSCFVTSQSEFATEVDYYIQ